MGGPTLASGGTALTTRELVGARQHVVVDGHRQLGQQLGGDVDEEVTRIPGRRRRTPPVSAAAVGTVSPAVAAAST